MAEKAKNHVAVAGLLFAFLMQLLTGAYFYGRLAERVDAIDRNTQMLLDYTLKEKREARTDELGNPHRSSAADVDTRR